MPTRLRVPPIGAGCYLSTKVHGGGLLRSPSTIRRRGGKPVLLKVASFKANIFVCQAVNCKQRFVLDPATGNFSRIK